MPPPSRTVSSPDLSNALVIDVRTPQEYADRHIAQARNIPYDHIPEHQAKLPADKNRPIIVYCKSGVRAWSAQKTLRKLGYTNVRNGVCIAQLVRAGFAELPSPSE